jgi:hypothetical protein
LLLLLLLLWLAWLLLELLLVLLSVLLLVLLLVLHHVLLHGRHLGHVECRVLGHILSHLWVYPHGIHGWVLHVGRCTGHYGCTGSHLIRIVLLFAGQHSSSQDSRTQKACGS